MTVKPNKSRVDAFIIGGGLAGIHLALAFDREGLRPLVIDQPDPHSSSRIAAGIINPITGRRFALTWLYDELQPVFTQAYPYWEKKLDAAFFKAVNIYRSVPENKLVNDLDAKLMDPAYEQYCRKMEPDEIAAVNQIMHWRSPGYVMKGYQLDTGCFLDHAILYLRAKRMYLQGHYEMPGDKFTPGPFAFQTYTSDNIVWATGAAITDHPHFSWIKMNPNKGEVLHVDIQGEPLNDIVKQSAFFVPLPENGVWIGSYNSWDFPDAQPTSEGLEYLKSKAAKLKNPYTLTGHLAAVRPAVEDRRPVIGRHPEHPGQYLFNGFGSKGSSLIPYFAEQMVAHMTKGADIHPEADLERYY